MYITVTATCTACFKIENSALISLKCINRYVLQCKVLIVSQELHFGPDNVGKGTLISERNVQRKHTNYVKKPLLRLTDCSLLVVHLVTSTESNL